MNVQVLSYVSGFFSPVVGPLLLLLLVRPTERGARQHMWASLAYSAVWLLPSVAIVSIDLGRLSVNGQETSGMGSLALAAVLVMMIATNVANVQRSQRGRPPLLFREEKSTRRGSSSGAG